MKLTKQGVRDLGAGTAKQHTHRYVPSTFTARGHMQTTMQCFCGAIREESDEERRARELAEENEHLEKLDAELYGYVR